MEALRIFQKNKISAEILNLKKNIERCENSIEELRKTTVIKDKEYLMSNISKNKESIESYQEKIDELEEKLTLLESGHLDEQILSEIKQNTNKVEKKNKESAIKKEKIDKTQQKEKQKSQHYFDNERETKYQARRLEFSMAREYERFCTIDVPDYMRQKLKGMPNNHGYIWKGILFYGEKDPDNGPVILHDRQRDASYVHEIYTDEHVIYRKIGNNDYNYQKEFVSSKPRKIR